jgi:hypothetical protein
MWLSVVDETFMKSKKGGEVLGIRRFQDQLGPN